MRFSGECEDLGIVLELIKEQYTRSGYITVSGAEKPDRAELSAEGIELDDVKFKKIRIVNFLPKDSTINFEPKNFEEYYQTALNKYGKSEPQRGFIYRSGPPKILAVGVTSPAPIAIKILLDENEEDFLEKYQALKSYLYGQNRNTLLTIKVFADGRVVRFVPKAIKESYSRQYNESVYHNASSFVRYVYINRSDETDLGTYKYFMVENLYKNDNQDYGRTNLMT